MTTGQTDNSNALFKESLARAIPPSNSFMLSGIDGFDDEGDDV
jgi:hypothetical protein